MNKILLFASCLSLAAALTACKREAAPAAPAPAAAAPAAPAVDPAAAPSPTAAAEPAAPSPTVAPAVPAVPPAPEPASDAARDVLGTGASFLFNLMESDDALRAANARCIEQYKEKGQGGLRARCVDAAVLEAAKEGIRFDKQDDAWTFVSFGHKADGSEEIFLKGPITLQKSKASELKFTPAGDFEGTQAAAMGADKLGEKKAAKMVMTVQVVDKHTVTMTAPAPKGRLLYRRK